MTDFTPQRDIQAISHINVVVDDIEVATEFYRNVLGFEQAANADGPMDYPVVDLRPAALILLAPTSRCSALRAVRTRSLPA